MYGWPAIPNVLLKSPDFLDFFFFSDVKPGFHLQTGILPQSSAEWESGHGRGKPARGTT